ncbi:unnamed protein product [Macrosiphum euphorbiae]|uniref:Uncharacterized protein n=1 Tax=Macrosiphum euphorbiae TaxID=13131 RepID=A0AAV0XXY0_9HEMI|nr:unnamed protein product [Macrosiphum euphorbiae]
MNQLTKEILKSCANCMLNLYQILKICILKIQLYSGRIQNEIIDICDIYWICRYKNCEAIINNNIAIIATLQKEVEDQYDKDVAQAIGILNSIQNSDFVVVVFILYEVLSIINVLSQQIQSKSATLSKSVNVIKSVVLSFNDLRSNYAFSLFWIKVKDFCDDNDIVLTTPSTGGVQSQKRKRKEPITLQDYALTIPTGATCSINEDECVSVDVYWRRTVYFRIIDDVISNLNKRFSDESLEIATPIDNFFNLNINESLFFINRYNDILGTSYKNLKAEMMVLKNCLRNNYLLEDVICACYPEFAKKSRRLD